MADTGGGEPPAPQQQELLKMCIEGDKVSMVAMHLERTHRSRLRCLHHAPSPSANTVLDDELDVLDLFALKPERYHRYARTLKYRHAIV